MRTAIERNYDRGNIVNYIVANGIDWVRVEPWMRASDITALVQAGRLERQVRTEYDRQKGHAANMFGGAGVMKRRRAYLRVTAS